MIGRNGSDLMQLVADALERIELRVASIAHHSHLNAMLAMADSDFVLPSPAITLIAVDPQHSVRLGPGCEFRTPGADVAAGEVVFASVSTSAVVHPWSVSECRWRPAVAFFDAGGALAEGIDLKLVRDPSLRCAPGWLSLAFEGGPALAWGLARAVVSRRGERARVRRMTELLTDQADAVPKQRWALRQSLDVLSECVLQVDIPRDWAEAVELDISIHFEEPVPYAEAPQAWSNALLAWNSLPHNYPDLTHVEQSVTGLRQQLVHALTTESLGDGWQGWSVTRVGPVGRPEHWARQRGGVLRDDPEYRVVFTPRMHAAQEVWQDRPALAVMLSQHSQRQLALLDQRLGVSFLATQGASANGIAVGTRCHLRSARQGDVQASGATVLIGSWGGTDGLTPDAWGGADADGLRAFLPNETPRRVRDVESALTTRFGDEVELVDAWDLLRTSVSDELEPLRVRVRFRRGERSPAERRAILRAAQRFVELYLGDTPASRLQLQDVDLVAEASL